MPKGRQAMAPRGEKLFLTESISARGKTPVYGPLYPGVTTAAPVMPVARSRLDIRSYFSVKGVKYS